MQYTLNKFIIIFCTCLASFTHSYAAEQVIVTFGLSKPPYVMEETKAGLEVDIVRESFHAAGYILVPRFMPLDDFPKALQSGIVDAVSPVNKNFKLNAYLSDSHINYQNFAITLDNSNFVINSLKDLSNKRISAFKNARLYLGNKFNDAADTTKIYREEADQVAQVKLLYKNRVDVVISDKNIFDWYKRKLSEDHLIEARINTKFHNIFKPTHYFMAFRNEELRNAFNDGLEKIKKNGIYYEIVIKYLE